MPATAASHLSPVTWVHRKPGPPLSRMMHRRQPLPPFNCIHVWGLLPFSADLSHETWTKVCLSVSPNPKYVRGYYGESLAAYPLPLAAAEKVEEFIKPFLTANAQQIPIFHSENFKRQQDFPFFFSLTCEVSPPAFIVIHLYLLLDQTCWIIALAPSKDPILRKCLVRIWFTVQHGPGLSVPLTFESFERHKMIWGKMIVHVWLASIYRQIICDGRRNFLAAQMI